MFDFLGRVARQVGRASVDWSAPWTAAASYGYLPDVVEPPALPPPNGGQPQQPTDTHTGRCRMFIGRGECDYCGRAEGEHAA